jgi:23S rRNA (pseudouridine1915-N3)-methyltransferase
MKWYIYTVGKPALAYAKTGVAEYLKRLRRYTTCEHRLMKRGDHAEIASLIDSQSVGDISIVLDERGQLMTTKEFVAKVEQWQLDAVKTVRLFIGGADGHNDEIRQRADLLLGLSGFTLQHELALVVLLEQIYRAHTILRGEPYHR